MKAIVANDWGNSSVLNIREVSPPVTSRKTVKLRARAWGVNFADNLAIAGRYQVKAELPFVPGVEVAGDVLECGSGVSGIQVGDRLTGYVRHGGYAEEVVVPEANVVLMPDRMSYVEGAAFPVAYMTAYLALARRAKVGGRDTVLVNGAGGAVGLAAVQIARCLGAYVVGAASSEQKRIAAKNYGAHMVIDNNYGETENLVANATKGKGFDVILESSGGKSFHTALRCVAFEGRIVVIGFTSGTIESAPAHKILIKNCSVVGSSLDRYASERPDIIRQSYTTLMNWYSKGWLTPFIFKTMEFDDIRHALDLVMRRQVVGKIVLTG